MRAARTIGRAPWARLAIVVLALGLAGCDLQCPGSDRMVRRAIRGELRRLPVPRPRPLRVEAGEISSRIEDFYRQRRDEPAWVTSRGPSERAHQLLDLFDHVGERGLDPSVYRIGRIRILLARTDPALRGPRPAPGDLARLDVACTGAWLLLATHVACGRVHPRAFDPDWHEVPRSADPLAALEEALASGDLAAPLDRLEPVRPEWTPLRAAYARYRDLAARGGWLRLAGGTLKPGARGDRVADLALRLAAEGDLDSSATPARLYDGRVRDAVRRFQRRHGLEPTGMVGAAEVEAMNVPAAERARQIAFNLERMRWVSDTLERRYAWINIPEYALRVIEAGRPEFECRVVVGRDSSPTPRFSAALKLMVLNPYWRIPPRIAGSEILEEIKRDRDYLIRNNIRVMDGGGRDAKEVDPSKVKWSKLHSGNFNYRLLQDPGPENAVGHVKFMCPNPYSVYLHDTPATWLFQKPERAFSHGCVRVEQPLALARELLRDKPGWDSLRIATAFDTCYNDVAFLPEPLPVHIAYFTAWPDPAGRIQFRRDVYGLDAALSDALKGQRPKPRQPAEVRPGVGPRTPYPKALPARGPAGSATRTRGAWTTPRGSG